MGRATAGSREQEEAALQEIEARYRSLVETSPDGVTLTDLDGVITVVSPRQAELHGYGRPEEMVGVNVFDLFVPEDRSRAQEELDRTVRYGSVRNSEYTLLKRDGTRFPAEISASAILDMEGKPRAVIGVTRDISERKRAEELTSYLAAIVECSNDAIIGKTLEGVITSWNSGAERLYGYRAEEVIGRSLSILIPNDRPGELRRILEQIARGEPIRHLETVRVRKDGVRIDVSLSISPIKDAAGRIIGAATIAQDITERKRAQEERARLVLQAQEEERRRIARELHDETAQALSTLLLQLDLLDQHVPAGAEVLESGLTRARELARRTLDEVRTLAHGLRPTVLDDLGLVAALQWFAEDCRRTFGVEVTIDATELPIERLAPEVEVALFRIAQEALTNMGKYAGARTACVELSATDRVARLVVEDNGEGFDRGEVEGSGHRGLGLRGMEERAALLGGTLTVESAPGRGTRITALVPLSGHSGRPGRPDEELPENRSRTRSIRVLLADDHALFREGLRTLLTAHPRIAVVGEADDGRRAVELVEDLRPDVVIMDITMPHLNGLDATRQIKRRHPEVHVVILTMHENRQYLAGVVQAGAEGCVLKRSVGAELIAAVEAVARGERYISPAVAGTLLEDYRVRIDRSGTDLLTEREREVLQLVAEGRTNREIADHLFLSPKTVEGHRASIMEKLGARDRTDLVKYAIRTGMITPE